MVPPDTITDLLQQVAGGDESAFRQLFELYQPKLETFVRKLTRDPAMAEEVVQDIFLKLWLQRADLTGIRNFDTYLFVISRNHVYSLFRAIMAEKRRIEQWAADLAYEEAIDQAQGEGLSERYAASVQAAIARLSPQQHTVYHLKRHEGKTYKEIAELMQLSPETVKKHLEAALRNISAYLQSHIQVPVLLLAIPLTF